MEKLPVVFPLLSKSKESSMFKRQSMSFVFRGFKISSQTDPLQSLSDKTSRQHKGESKNNLRLDSLENNT